MNRKFYKEIGRSNLRPSYHPGAKEAMKVVLPLIKKTCAKRKNKGINRKAYIVGRRSNLRSSYHLKAKGVMGGK